MDAAASEGEAARLVSASLRFVRKSPFIEIGEILSVQFKQLRWDLNELHLSNRTTKGLRTRYLPLSQELRAMLELRRFDPDGEKFGPDAYVFGNEVGERLKNYQKAWSTLRLRTIGHGPHSGPNGRFLPCCREQLLSSGSAHDGSASRL